MTFRKLTQAVCLFLIIESTFADSNFTCPVSLSLNISSGTSNGSHIFADGLVYPPGLYFKRDNDIFGCVCNITRCIRKCCPPGKLFYRGDCLQANLTDNDFEVLVYAKDEPIGPGNFTFLYNHDCPGDYYRLAPEEFPEDITHIQADGLMYFPEVPISIGQHMFCVDNFLNDGNSTNSSGEFSGIVCFPEQPALTDELYSSGMIISMPFLLATFLVYALLPDRNLPAKALMCYVLSLLFAYILLVTIQLNAGHKATTCISLAFFCYYFFMASFFWMNASCLDIFFTFSGIRGLLGDKKKEHKRFAYYSAYAWGVPLLMVGFASIFTFAYTDANNSFYTGLGQGQCWFRNGWATGIYFYFPIAILLIVNMVLFGVTTYKIKRVQKDTKMLKNVDSRKHKYDNNDKQRFNLYVKLLFAMGINWSMEVISWAIMWKWANVPDYVWVLTDFCNAVYGVFIFFIFVFKRNIWMLLKKRYLQLTGRPQQAHNLTSTHRTTVSQVSSSEA